MLLALFILMISTPVFGKFRIVAHCVSSFDQTLPAFNINMRMSPISLVVICLFDIWLIARHVTCGVTPTSPDKVAVDVGSAVNFSCTTDSNAGIRWYHRPSGSGTGLPLTSPTGDRTSPNATSRHSVIVSGVSSQLRIAYVLLEDSGSYCCQESTGGVSSWFELTVRVAAAGPFEYRLVAVGDSITFECQARDVAYISWDFKSSGAGTDALIYNGRFVKHEYLNKTEVEIDENNGRSRLLLKRVRMSDAGTYRCTNTGGNRLLITEVVVLDGSPECSLNTSLSLEEMTVIGINCTMCTSGIVVPVIECYDSVTHQLLANASRSNETCNYDAMVTVANEHIHGSRIECIVSVGTKNEVGTDHRWTSPNITVLYGPHRVTISPKEVAHMRVSHGETLRCSANSNPTAEFVWTVTGNPTAGHVGSEYTVDVCKLIYHDISSQCSFTDKAGQSQTSKMTLKCSAFRPDRPEKESVDSVHIEIEHLRADCERCPEGDGPYSVTIDKGYPTEFRDGDRLLCNADGNWRPNYIWTSSGCDEKHSSRNGPHFIIDICEIIPEPSYNMTWTRSYCQLECIANDRLRTRTAIANIVVVSSVEDRRRCGMSGNYPSVYPVAGGSGAVGLVIVIVTVVCCVKYSRYCRSQRAAVSRRAGLYTPNNPFYDDAQAADPDHDAELPIGYSGLQCNDEPYEEIKDDDAVNAVANTTGETDLLNPLPYQRLASEQRELSQHPGVYRQLGDTTGTTDISSGYIDVIDPNDTDTKPTPYQKLESESRDQPAPPGEYIHLGDTTIDSTIPTDSTPGYIDIIDDEQWKSAPSSYQKLKSGDLPQQPAPPSEYNKLTDTVVVTENNAVYSSVIENDINF